MVLVLRGIFERERERSLARQHSLGHLLHALLEGAVELGCDCLERGLGRGERAAAVGADRLDDGHEERHGRNLAIAVHGDVTCHVFVCGDHAGFLLEVQGGRAGAGRGGCV